MTLTFRPRRIRLDRSFDRDQSATLSSGGGGAAAVECAAFAMLRGKDRSYLFVTLPGLHFEKSTTLNRFEEPRAHRKSHPPGMPDRSTVMAQVSKQNWQTKTCVGTRAGPTMDARCLLNKEEIVFDCQSAPLCMANLFQHTRWASETASVVLVCLVHAPCPCRTSGVVAAPTVEFYQIFMA